jgi:DNA-directed RNA polymerase subunit F
MADEILSEKLVSNSEAKDILKSRSKDTELGFEPKNALEYLKKYDKLTKKQSKDLMEELGKVEKLRERQIITIVNLLPEDNDDLRLVLEKDYAIFSNEEKELILKTVKKFI